MTVRRWSICHNNKSQLYIKKSFYNFLCLLVAARRFSQPNEANSIRDTIKAHLETPTTTTMYDEAKTTMMGKINTLKVGHVVLHHSSWFFIYLNAFAQGYCLNITEVGVYICSKTPPPPFVSVALTLFAL